MTSMAAIDPYKCPDCGGELVCYGPEDICAGYYCKQCGGGVVATNRDWPGFDRTHYDLWVDCAGKSRESAIAAIAAAFGIGVIVARDTLDSGRPFYSKIA